MVAKKLQTNPRILLTICIAVAGFFISISHYIFNLIYTVQPTPYLDEIFHIPQATKYFRGLFHEWDSKITTLPGLYLLSVGVLKPVSWLIGKDICNVYALRITNLTACVANYYLLYTIQTKLQQSRKDVPTLCLDLLSVVNMASFPVLYFFTFLYYTDTVSIMLVLLTYLLHLEKCNILAAATGLVSIAVRQTNVIWVAFFAAQTVAQILKRQFSIQKRKMIWEMLRHIWKRGVNTFSNFVTALLQEMWGYIIVCFGFLVFIYMNGGIVVGDKSAHEAV
ncbi:Putative Dol-P-Glc:Glc(2)Man(9)GlcNAc(2)-PP-Dol alpha-1,2-glucosyltransferase, partial [Gryllus bimaculatus]